MPSAQTRDGLLNGGSTPDFRGSESDVGSHSPIPPSPLPENPISSSSASLSQIVTQGASARTVEPPAPARTDSLSGYERVDHLNRLSIPSQRPASPMSVSSMPTQLPSHNSPHLPFRSAAHPPHSATPLAHHQLHQFPFPDTTTTATSTTLTAPSSSSQNEHHVYRNHTPGGFNSLLTVSETGSLRSRVSIHPDDKKRQDGRSTELSSLSVEAGQGGSGRDGHREHDGHEHNEDRRPAARGNSVDQAARRKSGTHLLLYTRAVPLPKRLETATEYRFLMRLTQMFMAGAAFASLATASFNVNYTSSVLAVSGINLMCFTSISSLFVSFGSILVYCFPAFIGVPPHRHPRFSRVEVGVDILYFGFWVAAPIVLLKYGRCPRLTFGLSPESISCLPWSMCTAFGFACAALFLGTVVMGIRDLKRYGVWNAGRGNGVMWARGSWKEWAESTHRVTS